MRIFSSRWYTVFKWIRDIITSTIVEVFDAAGQSIVTFKFSTLLPREMTCINKNNTVL